MTFRDRLVPQDVERLKGATGTLSESGLYYLLLSPSNEVADPAKVGGVFQDMTKARRPVLV